MWLTMALILARPVVRRIEMVQNLLQLQRICRSHKISVKRQSQLNMSFPNGKFPFPACQCKGGAETVLQLMAVQVIRSEDVRQLVQGLTVFIRWNRFHQTSPSFALRCRVECRSGDRKVDQRSKYLRRRRRVYTQEKSNPNVT